MSKQTYGIWARYLVLFTLMIGVGFHVTRLVIGVDAFQELFQPWIDELFSIPMILGVAAMALGWRSLNFGGKFQKGVGMITLAYFAGTMPLHVRSWYTQDTSYIASFPLWYGFVFLSYTAVLLWVWINTRIQVSQEA